MLYVKLKKAFYETLQSTLLFWRLSSDTLVEFHFNLNEYDKYVAHKTINGWQSSIIWHLDDLKISHIEKKIIEDIIIWLNDKKFGKESPLTTMNGNVLEYLGMTLDYTTKGTVIICMYEYINKELSELLIWKEVQIHQPPGTCSA